MIMRRFILGFFVFLLGVVLLTGQTSASSMTEQGLSEVTVGDYFVPHPLEPQLSSDGQSMYNGVAPVVYVADPNPPKKQVRVPPPLDLAQASESASATFSITYIPNGGTDNVGSVLLHFSRERQSGLQCCCQCVGQPGEVVRADHH